MQICINGGSASLSGNVILGKIDMEINTASRIAIVGRNGCGKTTLLKILSGELRLDDPTVLTLSGQPTVGKLDQMTFADDSVTMVDEIRSAYGELLEMRDRLDKLLRKMEDSDDGKIISEYSSLLDRFTVMGGFYFEKEYEAAIKRFGFTEEEKHRSLSEFSGGQRTKIAFLKLLLSKPDLLLLDEPTNHLDIEAVKWLEEYLAGYKKAFVVVSHDRMFLDKTVNEVYEIEYGQTERYSGNYTDFAAQKKVRAALAEKQYATQQKEIEHLNSVVERFRYKATKAAMAQSKIKQLERITPVNAPRRADNRVFHTSLAPARQSAKEVLIAESLKIGFDRPLSEVSFKLYRGRKTGIIGGNGLGKSTLLKTVVGKIPPLGGEFRLGAMTDIGYFDQQMAQYTSANTVLEDFKAAFPSAGDFEARSALGAFLFSGEDVFKTVDMLSGGERVRLALCKLFRTHPNFLVLDEPTNHMDIPSKEALEDMLADYEGTLLFVSHDRYFIKKLADSLLVFKKGDTEYFEHGYEQYENNLSEKPKPQEGKKVETVKPQKKTYTTPAKEKARRERAIKKAEEKIALLEEKIDGIKEELAFPENASDYLKLSELSDELRSVQDELDAAMTEWERLAAESEI